MLRFWRRNSEKGQDLIEYALLLAIVVGIGGFIYSQSGLADSIKSIFGSASKVTKIAALQTYDLNGFLDFINEFQKKYTGGTAGRLNEDWNRGMFMSTWLDDKDGKADDKDKSTIQDFLDAMGAKVWSYYNGKDNKGNVNPEDQGLYWSTENLDQDVNDGNLHQSDKDYSSEKVLSYYYDGDKFYVIKNNVWMNQGHNKGIGMAAKSQEGNQDKKPPAEYVNAEGVSGPDKVGYNSFAEAKKAYEAATKKNTNKVNYIF